MRVECSNCHKEFELNDMMQYNPSSKAVLVCWKCWKAGQSEVTASEIDRKRKRIKEANSKK